MSPNINIPALAPEPIDPNLCRSSESNHWLYSHLAEVQKIRPLLTAGAMLPAEDMKLDGLRQSIIESGGNCEPGIVVALATPSGTINERDYNEPKGVEKDGPFLYEVKSGHRRRAACAEAGLLFYAKVLPPDTPAELVLRIAIEANSTIRDRSPVHIIREADLLGSVMREAAAERKRSGRKLTDEEKKGDHDEQIARLFFQGRRSAEYVRKLRLRFELSQARGNLWDEAEEDRRKPLGSQAIEFLEQIDQATMTVGEAWKKLGVRKRRTVSPEKAAAEAAEKAAEAEMRTEAKVGATASRLVYAVSLIKRTDEMPNWDNLADSMTVEDRDQLRALTPEVVTRLLDVYLKVGSAKWPRPRRTPAARAKFGAELAEYARRIAA